MRTLSGRNAVKTGGVANTWDSQVTSSVGYTGAAYASVVMPAIVEDVMFGVATNPLLNATYTPGDNWLMYASAANQIQIIEAGIVLGGGTIFGTWAAGDRLAVKYDGTNVTYLKNGVALRTVAVAIALPLFFDSTFFQSGATLNDIRFGPTPTPEYIAFIPSAGITLSGTPQRAAANAAQIASHTIVEITDPDGNWRDLSQAVQGTDWLNGGSIEETADGNSQRFNMTLQRDVRGFQILSNPEFAGGSLNGYGVYGDGGSGITLTAEADVDAPSGWRLKVTHPAGGAPAPGIGGFYRGINVDSGVYTVNAYHKGARLIYRIIANIPVGSSINLASNPYGAEGSARWLTSQQGTGVFQEYLLEQIIGTTGTFSTTAFLYLSGGVRPLTWYVRLWTITDTTTTLMTSLVPLRTDTAANRNAAGSYAPILDLNRKWRVKTATLPPGQAPLAADYEEVGNGFYDSLAVNDTPAVIQISGRDAGAVLLDGYIRTKRSYGSAGGVSLESALQSMIDDNAADNNYLPSTSGGLTLYVPVATGLIVNTWEQQPGNLMQALNAAAGKLGYIVRFRYDAADVLRLTLWKPNRGATIEDFTIGPSEYLNIPFNKLGPIDQVKNIAEVRFFDTASGTIHTIKSPNPETSASITKYGKRYIGFDVSSSGPINSDAKGQILVDAARSDLETPALEQQIESFGLWWVQLGDYVKTLANGTHYDTDQLGGVMAFTHTFGAGTWRTIVNLKGKPAGRYGTWLSQGTTDLTGGATPSPLNPPVIAVTRSFVTPPTTTQESVLVTGGLGTGGSGFQWRYRVIQENTVAPAWGAFSTVPALPVEVTVTRGLKWKRTIEVQATDASGVIAQDAYDIASKMDALNDNGIVDDTVNMSGGARPFKRGIDQSVDVISTSSRGFIDQAGLDLSLRPTSVYRGSGYEAVSNLFKRGTDTAADVVITTVRTFVDPNASTQVDANGRIVGVYRLGVYEPVNNLVKVGDSFGATTMSSLFLNGALIDLLTVGSGGPTAGNQIVFGTSSVVSAVGTMFSSGNLLLTYNAKQPTYNADSWQQNNGALRSALLELGAGGLAFYTAVAGKATAVKATFWGATPLFQITDSVGQLRLWTGQTYDAVLITAQTSTNAVGQTFTNGAGRFFIGLESSGGTIIGAGVYAGYIWQESARDIVFGTNNIVRARFRSTGALSMNNYIYLDQAYEHGLVGLYDPMKVRMIYAIGDLYRLPAGGSSVSGTGPGGQPFFGLFFGYDATTTYINHTGKNLSHGLGVAANGVVTAYIGSGMWTSGQSYASDFVLV